MGVNFKGEKVEYHGFQAKCVELLRAVVEGMKADQQTAYKASIEEEREKQMLLLQVDQMRDVVDAACAYESILGHDDLNSAYRNRREVTDAFVKAVGAYKTRLPGKRVSETERLIEIERALNAEIICDCGVPGCNKLYDHRK